jgi:hypothetical protein
MTPQNMSKPMKPKDGYIIKQAQLHNNRDSNSRKVT